MRAQEIDLAEHHLTAPTPSAEVIVAVALIIAMFFVWDSHPPRAHLSLRRPGK
jgi:hypothetical protein